jgi:dTDP-4-dehydrorhamnose reductase
LDRQALDITNAGQIERVIHDLKPWAIINTAGYVRVDDAEDDSESCYQANTNGPCILAEICGKYDIKLLMFSSDLVFDGTKALGYLENDLVHPLNIYGDSKAKAEREVLRIYAGALIVRTAAFFGPWDNYNFVSGVINTLKKGRRLLAEKDVLVSPTYIPDLVDNSLNLLLDDECGIWHLSNEGVISWADLAIDVAARGKLDRKQIEPVLLKEMNYKAARPKNSALASGKGIRLPALQNALDRYFSNLSL